MAYKLAYIVPRFPSLYQTYIANELADLTQRGFSTHIFSLKKPRTPTNHGTTASSDDNAYYTPYLLSARLLYSQIYFLIRHPFIYLSTLASLARHNYRHPPTLLKAVAAFPKTVHYARVMQTYAIDHIHAHWATIPALSALVIFRLTGIPYSLTAHAIDIFNNGSMLSEKFSKARFVLTCNEYSRLYLLRSFPTLNPAKVTALYHGVDLELFRPRPAEPTTPFKILSVGRMEPSKGFPYLLQACAQLRSRGIPFECTLIGDGPDEHTLRQLIGKLGLGDHVILHPAVPYKEIPQYYARSHLFVLPAVSECHWGIPNVLIEAMAVGVPVITTPLPAIPELVRHRVNGIIVPEKDPLALSNAVQELIQSPDLRRRFAQYGRAVVEELFDQRRTSAILADRFERCPSRKGHVPVRS